MSALKGIRILDFSRVLAGPLATMVLADLGAEVLKVERPGVGDETRSWGPPYDERGVTTYFDAINRNKRSILLNLDDPQDVEQARRLAAEADALVENFRPGLLKERGLGYEALAVTNPGLVYCSITGFGSHAGAELPGYDLLVQAVGGLMSITGDPDGQPQKAGAALVDVITGLFASTGMLAALRHRDDTGEGQLVEINLLSCLLAALVNQASGYTVAGHVPARIGNAHPSIAPYDLLHTADGELILAVGNDRQFRALCEQLGQTELAEDSRFATNSARVANRNQLLGRLETLLANRSAAEWCRLLTAARVPAGQVNDLGAAFDLASRLGLDPIVELSTDDGHTVRLPRNPIGLSRTPATYRSAPPLMPHRDKDPSWSTRDERVSRVGSSRGQAFERP